MIKIAFIIDTIESPTAGTEKQLLMLIKHLNLTKFKPFLCVLRTTEWLNSKFKDCELINIDFQTFGSPSSYLNLLNFSNWLRKNKIDIVQTYFVEGNKIGIIAARLAGITTIISTRRNQGYWHSMREVMFLRILNKWVSIFLANSEDTRRWVAKVEGINLKRIKVIHNSLKMEDFYKGTNEQRLKFREQLFFSPDSIIVGIVANLRPVKELEVFVKAASLVFKHCTTVRFVIVGDGPLRLELEELCARLEIAQIVRFLGKREDVPHVLSCIDIGVLSSRSESFSNSIIEYMAAGLAVVCTDVGGAKEAIENGDNGYVVQPGNFNEIAEKIIHIIKEKRINAMGFSGMEKANSMFSLNKIIDMHMKFFDTIINEKNIEENS